MSLKRHDVEMNALDMLYELIEAQTPAILAPYGDDERRRKWAEEQIAHVLKTLNKWADTIEARVGDKNAA